MRSLDYNLIDDSLLSRNDDSASATITFRRTDGIIHIGANIIQATYNACKDSEYKHAINLITDNSSLFA